MAFKLIILACAIVSAVNAGLEPLFQYSAPVLQPHAITSTSDNIVRSHGNLAQIATQSKTIDTPFSSSSKTDVRVSNPAIYAHHAAIVPQLNAAVVPQLHAAVVPQVHAAVAPGPYYSPAVAVSHMTYSSPLSVYHY